MIRKQRPKQANTRRAAPYVGTLAMTGCLIGVAILVFSEGLAAASETGEPAVAVLCDSFPESPAQADPQALVRVLSEAGYTVQTITSGQLADPNEFNAGRFWLVVLPYGAYFPVAARGNFLAYLRAGGDFFSTGGYAFDKPVAQRDGVWLDRRTACRDVRIGLPGDQDYLIGAWHAREADAKRWSGKDAGVRLPVNPGARYTLEIVLQAANQEIGVPGRLLLNGKSVLDIPSTGGQTLRVPVTPETIGGKDTLDVVFDVELWRPSERDGSPDTRALGVSVQRVRLIEEGKEEDEGCSSVIEPINMRLGKPNDFLEWEPEQLGVFDAGYRLEQGRQIAPAPDQYLIVTPASPQATSEVAGLPARMPALPEGFRLTGEFEGWAAAGTTGSQWYWTTPTDRSRLVPLLETRDRLGRFVGNAGALMVNHLEPYRGSLWSYFGVENRDIFSEPDSGAMLLGIVKGMRRGIFLHDARPSFPCYRQGEAVALSVNVSNFGGVPQKLEARFEIAEESGAVVFSDKRSVTPAPGETVAIAAEWAAKEFKDDFYHFRIDLAGEDGTVIDTQRDAFYVWNIETISNGMNVTYADNFLRDDGAARFLIGAQAFYVQKTVTGNSALDVEKDFSMMADMGMHISRSFTRVKDERFIDALVMAGQRHRVAFFLEGVAEPSPDPKDWVTEGAYASKIAERYRDVPGLMIDIRNEPNLAPAPDEKMDREFSKYLAAHYADETALRAAWGTLEEGETFSAVKTIGFGNDWIRVRSRDTYRFLLDTGRRWIDTITAAIKSADSKRLVSVGYLQWWPEMTMDPMVTSDALDFTDRHWYGPVSKFDEYDALFAASDRRYCGKAPSTGEFGSKTFPTFAESGHNYDTAAQQELRYLHVTHYALALGGMFASNWHWRDPLSNIFPYGIVYSDWTPKPTVKTNRAMSLLFSTLHPRYVAPEIYLVLPDESRFGGNSDRIFRAIGRAVSGLMGARLRFGTIGEWDLARLPREARLVLVPSPFALSDAGYEALRAFASSGGTLYISGDFSFGENRTRTDQTDRLEALAGVTFVCERYPDIRWEKGKGEEIRYADGPASLAELGLGAPRYEGRPAIEFSVKEDTEVLAWTGERPVAVKHRLGQGQVVFSADPAEFFEGSPLDAIYGIAAKTAGIKPEQADPASPELHVFRIPLEKGEAVVVGNISKKQQTVEVRLNDQKYSVSVGSLRQATLVVQDGKLTGIEAQGEVRRDGKTLVNCQSGSEAHFFLVALDAEDIAQSDALALVCLHECALAGIGEGFEAEAGEVVNKTWNPLELLRTERDGSLAIPRDLAGDLILLAPKDKLVETQRRAVVLLTQ